jgi:hypothetical protein
MEFCIDQPKASKDLNENENRNLDCPQGRLKFPFKNLYFLSNLIYKMQQKFIYPLEEIEEEFILENLNPKNQKKFFFRPKIVHFPRAFIPSSVLHCSFKARCIRRRHRCCCAVCCDG